MEEYQQLTESLEKDFVVIAGVKTAVYRMPTKHAKTVLFLHGVGGDFHGVIPLAYELKDEVKGIFVDMPSHGETEIVKDTPLEILDAWAKELVASLQKHDKTIKIDTIIAHSFGCSVAAKTGFSRILYINPPLKVSSSMKLGARAVYYLRSILKPFYNAYWFAMIRGWFLLKNKNREAIRRLKWLTLVTNSSQDSFIEFAKVVRNFVNSSPLQIPEGDFVGIISAKYDNVVSSVKESDVKCDLYAELETGHMPAIEMPDRLAHEIRRSL